VATDTPTRPGSRQGSGAGKLAREVSSLQASLLGKLHEEMAGGDAALFAAAAQKLAEEFGSVTATAVGTLWERDDVPAGEVVAEGEHPSLYRPGQMRRRLDQLLECHRRYEQPFGLVVFDVATPVPRRVVGVDGPVLGEPRQLTRPRAAAPHEAVHQDDGGAFAAARRRGSVGPPASSG